MDKDHCFDIVAHRGVATYAPENTLPAFERAIELGADCVELDVRLSSDQVPMVYHYYYLDHNTSGSGAIFNYTYEQLRGLRVFSHDNSTAVEGHISSLSEVLGAIGGRVQMEIEIKGPEPESAQAIGAVLKKHRKLWKDIEITSYYPAFLLAMQRICPGLTADLLYHLSSSWMKSDVVQYEAIQLSQLAQVRAVHLHPSQLSRSIIDEAHKHGIEVHAYDVNDLESLQLSADLGIPRICTDNLEQALAFRAQYGRQ